MRIIGIIHLLYQVPRDLIVFVRSMWHPYSDLRQGAAQIRTASVRKFRLHNTAPFGMLYYHTHFQNRIPIVRGTMGPHSFFKSLA